MPNWPSITPGSSQGSPGLEPAKRKSFHWWTGGTNRLRFYANANEPESPSVHPVFPRGGQTFRAGQVRFIRWHAAIPEADRADGLPRITIELSTAGPAGPWRTVADAVPTNGRHQWRIPADVRATRDAHLRLTLATDPPVSAVTPEPFTILSDCPPPDCPTDWNCDGASDSRDVLAFLADWAAGHADYNDDGATDTLDVLAFLNDWSQGCG